MTGVYERKRNMSSGTGVDMEKEVISRICTGDQRKLSWLGKCKGA